MTEGPDPAAHRSRVLADWEENGAGVLALLGVVWLGLLIRELVGGPAVWVHVAACVIWALFLADFLVKLALAPDRARWLRGQWLTLLSLVLPPFRVLRFARALGMAGAAAGGPLRLVRDVAVLNDGASAARRVLRRSKAGYATALTALVLAAGAAGMLAAERDAPGSAIVDYGGALWWTAMLLTTVGSAYWPQTPEGQAICLALAVYGCAVFGYVTAAIAAWLLRGD